MSLGSRWCFRWALSASRITLEREDQEISRKMVVVKTLNNPLKKNLSNLSSNNSNLQLAITRMSPIKSFRSVRTKKLWRNLLRLDSNRDRHRERQLLLKKRAVPVVVETNSSSSNKMLRREVNKTEKAKVSNNRWINLRKINNKMTKNRKVRGRNHFPEEKRAKSKRWKKSMLIKMKKKGKWDYNWSELRRWKVMSRSWRNRIRMLVERAETISKEISKSRRVNNSSFKKRKMLKRNLSKISWLLLQKM